MWRRGLRALASGLAGNHLSWVSKVRGHFVAFRSCTKQTANSCVRTLGLRAGGWVSPPFGAESLCSCVTCPEGGRKQRVPDTS